MTPRATRAPIAPTFRSGSPRAGEAGIHVPERPSTRIALQPELGADPDHRLLERPHVGDHVHRLAQLDDRVGGELPGPVPGDLAAPVHVDDRGPRVADGPVGHRRPLPRRIDGHMLKEQAAVGDLAADPPRVHRALHVPALDVVHGVRPEACVRVNEFSIHDNETTTRVRPPRRRGTNQIVINEADLREMSPARAAQAGALARHRRLPAPAARRINLARGRLLGVLVSVFACAVLVGWIIVLGLTLHRSFHTQHWKGAWVGFDVHPAGSRSPRPAGRSGAAARSSSPA